MNYNVKRDANHDEILAVFEIMLAGNVTDTSRAGDGLGDLYVSYGCYGMFVEIKRDKGAAYTAAQVRFAKRHPGCIARVENVEQAENVARIVRARGMALANESG